MLKILKSLSERFGADYTVFYLDDYWGNGDVREKVTIGHLIGWFQIKENNMFYNTYSITSHFKELCKHIEKQERPIRMSYFFKDSYDKFMTDFKEKHPNEVYEEFIEKERRKRPIEWNDYVLHFLEYICPYKL